MNIHSKTFLKSLTDFEWLTSPKEWQYLTLYIEQLCSFSSLFIFHTQILGTLNFQNIILKIVVLVKNTVMKRPIYSIYSSQHKIQMTLYSQESQVTDKHWHESLVSRLGRVHVVTCTMINWLG